MKIYIVLYVSLFVSSCSLGQWVSPEQKTPPTAPHISERNTLSSDAWSGASSTEIVLKQNTQSDDCDMDSLSDALEREFWADPCKVDTDEDWLSDIQEIQNGYPYLDPSKKDTDENGIDDFHDDFDKDGVTNGEEIKIWVSPVSTDSDGDGLTDTQEVSFWSDAGKADSDADWLSDKIEYEWWLSPNKKDGDTEWVYPVAYELNWWTTPLQRVDAWIYTKWKATDVERCKGAIRSWKNHVFWDENPSIVAQWGGNICDTAIFVEKIAISQTGSMTWYQPTFKFDPHTTEQRFNKGELTQEDAALRYTLTAWSSKDRETHGWTVYEYDIGDFISLLAFTK